MSELVGPGSKYTDEQRRQAAILYAINGTATSVESELNIPARTVNDWRNSEWWESIVAEVRLENNDRLIAKAQQIIDSATDITLEKLPEASAKDAATIGAIYVDKLRLSLNQPTSISGKAEGIEDLAAQFRALSKQWEEKHINVVSEQKPEATTVSD